MSNWKARHTAVSLVGAGLLLAGCGLGGGNTTTTTAPKKTTTPLPTAQITLPASTVPVSSTVVPPVSSTNQPGPGGSTGGASTYTVQNGDAWFKIAQTLKVDLQALLDANGMTLTTPLFAGMRLNVPPPSASTAPPLPPNSSGTTTTVKTVVPVGGTYVVVANDYWAGIATKVGVKLADLLAVNGATVTTVIHPGQTIKVPKGANTTGTTTTTAKAGATTTTTVKKP